MSKQLVLQKIEHLQNEMTSLKESVEMLDITDESTDIKYTFFGEQGLPDTMSYGGFKKTWLDIDEIEMENFIKDQYLLDLWAKGILRSKKIKEFRVIFIPFALALITLSLGSILLVVDILN